MKNNKFVKLLSGKGYYALLLVCVVAAGTFTYAAVRSSLGSSNKTEEETPYDYQYVSPDENSLIPEEEENPSSNPEQGPTKTVSPATIPTAPDTSATETAKETTAEVSNPIKATQPSYIMPVDGGVIRAFSDDELVFSATMNDYRVHQGVDIAAAVDTAVKAIADGVVDQVYVDDMMGTTVVIVHADGKKSLYANLQPDLPTSVAVGATIKAGDTIGAVGTSALAEISDQPHLHLALLSNGEYVDPMKVLKN